MTYEEAAKSACAKSLLDEYKGCRLFIVAKLGWVDGMPAIVGYGLSDWYDGSVVISAYRGELEIV